MALEFKWLAGNAALPVINLIPTFSSTSTFLACALLSHVEQQNSAQKYTSAKTDVLRHEAVAPQDVPASLRGRNSLWSTIFKTDKIEMYWKSLALTA